AACIDVFEWSSLTPSQPPNFSVPTGAPVHLVVSTLGVGIAGSFAAVTTAGSTDLTSVSGTDCAVGQLIIGGEEFIPAGSRLAAWSPPTASFGNGEWDEDANRYLDPVGALGSVGGFAFQTVEDAPIGTLAAVVSPGTGVTIFDQNSDGTGNVSHLGDGSVMANLTGQGWAVFQVTFSDTGTFRVSANFAPPAGDANFAAASASPITITVT
ncbi:MAG: Ig-like domain-containing protein, partial [Acidimicrobiales bacterium]